MGHRTVNLNYPIDRIQQKPGGCGIASAAMDINYVTNKKYSYDDIFEANDKSVYVDWAKIIKNLEKKGEKGLKYTRIPSGSTKSTFAKLKTDLFNQLYYNKRPVIAYIENNSGGTHFVVVNGFHGTLSFLPDDNGNEYPSPAEAKADMFKIVDPGYENHYTLADVMNYYKGELKSLHFYYK
ncbi:C39 family peptidase [Lutispora thermophila]|uniref:Peptidase_C39 like family protein n=1 Tax=Lutispora thermophila DSM 19022 TaxID=1122184 RepID=A0A1M6I817_9FIRM|nr:C39 family peptidase [Lutispora thermophila]SHJ30614.1 Peptidase_C39 like family protein [Lutispora thermophila DSM 19022]